MLFVFRFMRGFLRIRVTGFSPERFMNLCSSHGILLWDITPCGCCYEMTVALPDFYRLKPILRKTKTRVHILGRTGFPFLMTRWRKRKLFFAGFLACAFFLVYLSTFIWAIDLEGGRQLTREMLLDFLSDRQIAYGVKKSSIDIDALEKSLRNEYPFITWTSSKIEGTKLMIYVKENDIRTGSQPEEKTSADLLADTDGVVESIITRQGVPLVQEGEAVKAGDILISGDVPIESDDKVIVGHQLVRADGDVLVRTSKSYSDSLAIRY
ncbi:MAG: sporulation protein YqfD, partial [Lachnospiraceae bacterium]|nr:sporulation protein YqfD [Lachnospiraceae bacterium]